MSTVLFQQLDDITLQLAPIVEKHLVETQLLTEMRTDPTGRHTLHDIRAQTMAVASLESRMKPLHERKTDIEAMLPSAKEQFAAKQRDAELTAKISVCDATHDTETALYITALEQAKIAADALLALREDRRKMIGELLKLRRDYNITGHGYPKTHTASNERRAYLLGTFLKQAATGFISSVVLRDLAVKPKAPEPKPEPAATTEPVAQS